MFTVKDFHKPERAFLVGVYPKSESKEEYEYRLSELKQLADTAEIVVVDTFIQAMEKPDSATLVGSGKLKEIIAKTEEHDITTLIFNDNLSSSQARNIAKQTKCNIVDRTELILDIFAKHAQTHESKLQVELAQLEYSYSKLRNLWQHFSRITSGVGVGTRGPGEKQIEIDRRLVRERIAILKDRLKEITKTTDTKRKKRANQISICLVGYTNAGKSTLFNLLTSEKIYAADELFATLDATTRSLNIDSKDEMVITDTIGFIENLPPTLIQSFYSTLSEVRSADLLLHIVDVGHPKRDQMIETTEKILKDIDAIDKDILMVFNKSDTFQTLHSKFEKKQLKNNHPDCIFISAKTGENIETLREKIKIYIAKRKTLKKYIIPLDMRKTISFLHDNTEIKSFRYNYKNQTYECETLIDRKIEKNIQEQLDKNNLLKYINKK